ncbi:phosphohistidine phosphatase SixA [Spirochaetota bacterium]
MKLYLVQHGDAVSKEEDPERPLSQRGKEESCTCAEYAQKAGIKVDAIWHSTKMRAAQTAAIFEEALSPADGVVGRDGLAPKDPVEPVFDQIEPAGKDIMIVGHLPFLSKLATRLICGHDEERDIIAFRNSGIVCIEKGDEGVWKIAFAAVPEIM